MQIKLKNVLTTSGLAGIKPSNKKRKRNFDQFDVKVTAAHFTADGAQRVNRSFRTKRKHILIVLVSQCVNRTGGSKYKAWYCPVTKKEGIFLTCTA